MLNAARTVHASLHRSGGALRGGCVVTSRCLGSAKPPVPRLPHRHSPLRLQQQRRRRQRRCFSSPPGGGDALPPRAPPPPAAAPAPVREPTGFRQKKGTVAPSVPQVLAEYKAERGGSAASAVAAGQDNGLLFSDSTLNGPVKYAIWALSVFLGTYAVFEMPVPRSTNGDHVFADIRAWYVKRKYEFFGVTLPHADGDVYRGGASSDDNASAPSQQPVPGAAR